MYNIKIGILKNKFKQFLKNSDQCFYNIVEKRTKKKSISKTIIDKYLYFVGE